MRGTTAPCVPTVSEEEEEEEGGAGAGGASCLSLCDGPVFTRASFLTHYSSSGLNTLHGYRHSPRP